MDGHFFSGKTVLVMGLGRFGGGMDAARFASKVAAKTVVTDMAKAEELSKSLAELNDCPNIVYHLGGHKAEDFEAADIIIVNPAVNPANQFLKLAAQHGRIVTSQINIFFEMCPAPIVAITGANGKSTTTALTAHLLRAGLGQKDFCFTNVWLGGNIGNEPLLSVIDQIKATDIVVLELSSFQLEHLAQIKKAPHVSLITNLTANHLDRHGTFEAYCAAKETMFNLQTLDAKNPAVSVFNGEDPIATKWFNKYKNDSGRVCYLTKADDITETFRTVFPLPGKANLENLAGAMAIARHFKVSDERLFDALPKFKSLPHRLEPVATINEVGYYNDSIATTPQSVMVALDAFSQPKIIIAGGYDKHIPFDELGEQMAQKAKAVILIGQTADKIAAAIRAMPKTTTIIEMADSMADAVAAAAKLAEAGDVVLMSPACASYDMFENFQQRGQIFRDLVHAMET
ncbi:MAG: UDP-N-acetylmuramoyl-L-alanine--D-glutamate ligase [Sedimentisphaerales bacterium]|nr:UDP-N-acetylmuramoyl-L-alanine--D-glutamate ligase [Sedimentisphaerales bacterium]